LHCQFPGRSCAAAMPLASALAATPMDTHGFRLVMFILSASA
jgi:hypothetical protein